MYCTKCGYKLAENAKFCIKCGTRVKDIESITENVTEPVKEEIKETKKKRKKWSLVWVILAVLIGGGSFAWLYYGEALFNEKNIDKTGKEEEVENRITDYDVILYEDSDYTIVAKKESGFDNVSIKIGVLNGKKSEWIHAMTDRHIFLKKDGWGRTAVYINNTSSSPKYGQIVHNEIRYIGDGMFVSRAGISANNDNTYLTFYNVNDNTGFMMSAAPITYSYGGGTALGRNYRIGFENGKAIVVDAYDDIIVVDTHGNSKSTKVGVAFDKSLGKYSCGFFFCSDGFYNEFGTKVIDLSAYKKQIYEYYGCYDGPYFESKNGTVKVYMLGATEEVYYMEVDYSGKFLTSEPVKK